MKIIEPIFHSFYLVTILYMSIKLVAQKRDYKLRLFGLMGIVLAGGDIVHLLPRVYAYYTTGLTANAGILGIGKLVTSITMAIFYLILLRIWEIQFSKESFYIRAFAIFLFLSKTAISFLPQNQWTSPTAPLDWVIYRNLPFVILGIFIIYLVLKKAYHYDNLFFKKIGAAVIVSFACYIPVIILTNRFSLINLLMIPKTLAYLYIIYIAYQKMNLSRKV
jgi:hypothetical protein